MRLIDVEPLEGLIKQHLETTDSALFFSALSTFARVLEMTPTADAVPVVRCKDCKHWSEMQNSAGACLRLCVIDGALWFGTDATDYCSFAERKGNE